MVEESRRLFTDANHDETPWSDHMTVDNYHPREVALQGAGTVATTNEVVNLGQDFLTLILVKVRSDVVVPFAQELQVSVQGLSHKSSLLEIQVNAHTSSMQGLASQLTEKFAQHESKIQSMDHGVLSQFLKVDGSMVVLKQSLEDLDRRER